MNTVLSPTELGTILAVWAHPDDETYLAGGLMAAAVDAGQRVVCVSATAGELGTADPTAWPPDRLGRLRRWEAAAAMAVLGVNEHRILGLPDGGLSTHDHECGIATMSALLADVQPDTILTFGPDGMTFHPDHITVSAWVTEAWKHNGCSGRLLYAATTTERRSRYGALYEELGVYMTGERPVGVPVDRLAVRVVLTGAALDRKIAALAAMASQTQAFMSHVGLDLYSTLAAEESFVDAGGS